MELKPSQQDIALRDAYSQQQLQAAEQAAHRTAEEAIAAEKAQRTAEDMKQRVEHYSAVLSELRDAATERNPHEFSSDTTQCLAAHATEWVPFGTDTSSKLAAECRYLSKDIVTTSRDHSQQTVIRRSFVEVIEIHYCDTSIEYVSSPEVVARLHRDEVTVNTPSGHWYYRFNTGGDWQAEVDDFIATVMEPIAVACGTNNKPGPDQPVLY